tara:strand:- start:22 stop:309 length:288 start_codon:yes stop_codon:yes gene_type:complete
MGNFITQPEFATEVAAITPSDNINGTTKLGGAALYVGTTGDVKLIISGIDPTPATSVTAANAVVFKNVSGGTFLPVICDYVLATGTDASDILSIK